MNADLRAMGSDASPAAPVVPALDIIDIQRSFGAVRAVDGASLTVSTGEIVGLIGPNGSGKSTLIDVVSGLEPCEAGDIVLDGVSVAHLAPYRRAGLGLRRTFQASRLWMHMSVSENLLAATPPSGRDRFWRTYLRRGSVRRAEIASASAVADVLDRFGLVDLRDQAAATLSGGQGRLLEFARIVVSGATVALLDEPLAGVNPIMAESVIAGIRQLQRGGISILLVEHNLSAVEDLCDRIYGMSQGKVVVSGSMQDITASEFFADAYIGTARTRGA